MSDTSKSFDAACPFCIEFERGHFELDGKQFPRHVYQTEHFVVFPALGAFIPGWLLIAPKEHYLNTAVLSESWSAELNEVVGRVRIALQSEYGPTVVFEHGPASWNARGGCCVEHAHIQIVSIPIDPTADLLTTFRGESIEKHSDLSTRWNHKPYLYFENQSEEKFLFSLPDVIPSQYMRQLIASKVGHDAQWNWRQHQFLDEMEQTIRRLRYSFPDSL
ncbi:MAG: HIT domain-containing protein [Patescibacteria group bacterium]